MSKESQESAGPVFRALVDKILNEPEFRANLLYQEDAAVRKEYLGAFLDEQGEFSEAQKTQALEDLIQVVESIDTGKMLDLHFALDNLHPPEITL